MTIVQLHSALLFDCNMYLIVGEDKTALIDTGTGFQIQPYISEIESVLGGRKLDYVFVTHRHYDHVGGLSAIIQKFSPSAVYAGELDAVSLREGDSESTLGTKFGGSIPPMDVKGMKEGDRVELGGYVLRSIDTPGHTIGSICLLEENTKSLFSGDCFFVDGVGRTDLPTASTEEMKKSLRKMQDVDFEALYPGHGPYVLNKGKPYVDNAIRIIEEL